VDLHVAVPVALAAMNARGSTVIIPVFTPSKDSGEESGLAFSRLGLFPVVGFRAQQVIVFFEFSQHAGLLSFPEPFFVPAVSGIPVIQHVQKVGSVLVLPSFLSEWQFKIIILVWRIRRAGCVPSAAERT
jgi:hypothetical protein